MVDYAGRHYLSEAGWYRYDGSRLVPVSASEVNMPDIQE